MGLLDSFLILHLTPLYGIKPVIFRIDLSPSVHLDFVCKRLPRMCRNQYYDSFTDLVRYLGHWDTVKSCANLHQFISSTFWLGKAFCFCSLDDSLSVHGFSNELGLCLRVFGAITPWNFLTVNIYQRHPTAIFGKISVRKAIWDLEFSEHLL